MSRPAALVSMAVLGSAAILAVCSLVRVGERTRTDPGSLEETEGAGARGRDKRWVRPGFSLQVRSGSSYHIQERQESALPAVPQLDSGALEVAASVPFTLGSLVLAPRGEARLSISESGVQVAAGTVEAGGASFGVGDWIPAEILPSWNVWLPRPLPARPRPDGRVADARTGEAIRGALVRATHSHHPSGYPPAPDCSPAVELRSVDGGEFYLPRPRLSDARLWLHLEVLAPGFLPEVLVLDAASRDVEGGYPFVLLDLRRGLAQTCVLYDPHGSPLARTPVELARFRDSFLADGDGARWPEPKSGETIVRYTKLDGTLDVEPGTGGIRVLDPLLELWDSGTGEPIESESVSRLGAPGETHVLHTHWREGRPYLLVDSDGVPVTETLVELERERAATTRLYTGAGGEMLLAPRLLPTEEGSFELSRPEPVTLRCLAPHLWRVERPIPVPARDTRISLPASPAATLRFRAIARQPDGTTAPVLPEQVRLDGDFLQDPTLVERSATGDVVFQGALPRPGTTLDIHIAGVLPEALSVPLHLPGAALVDLGEVPFDGGVSVALTLEGLEPDVARRARVWLRSERESAGGLGRWYSPGATGTAILGGLTLGTRYHVAVEVEEEIATSTEILLGAPHLESGVALVVPAPERVAVAGVALGIAPEDTPSYRVFERYYLAGEHDPISFPSYPLPPDGGFGSLRRMAESVSSVEVFVLGSRSRFARAAGALALGRTVDLGTLDIVPPRRAALTFLVEGLGQVGIPPGLALFAEERRYHEVARLYSSDGFLLEIENLLPGRHRLRWGEEGAVEEAFGFDVPDGAEEIHAAIRRRPLEVETGILSVVNAEGRPVRGAAVRNADAGFAGVREIAPGRYAAPIRVAVDNRIDVEATGYLPIGLELPAGRGLEEPLLLRRGARLQATLLGADRQPFDGTLSVVWSDAPPSTVLVGATPRVVAPEILIPVVRGRLEGAFLPEGESFVVFADRASTARLERMLHLSHGRATAVEGLRLLEGRTIRGTVSFPDGTPAAGARVDLMVPEHAHRFPFQARPADAVRFSVASDGAGEFRIDGLALEIDEDLALVAHLDGWTDAVVERIDAARDDYDLELRDETELGLRADYRAAGEPEGYEFRLAYTARLDGSGEWRDLGAVPAAAGEVRVSRGVTPGRYRLTWRARESPLDEWLESRESILDPYRAAELRLTISGRPISGRALWNGAPLQAGRVEATHDPGDPGTLRRALVRDGAFELWVPESVEVLYASVVPERALGEALSWARGEALPRQRIRVGARRDELVTIDTRAYDLTIHIASELLERPRGLAIEFPHYEWDGKEFRSKTRREEIGGGAVRLRLLAPGEFRFAIHAPGGWTRAIELDLDQDLDYFFSR